MVILLWFYALYPLWRTLLRGILRYSIPAGLVLLFAFQLGFNWWTTHPRSGRQPMECIMEELLQLPFKLLAMHYLLIFMAVRLAKSTLG